MRLVTLDPDTCVDVERIVAMTQQHYSIPTPTIVTTVYLRGASYVTVKASIDEVLAMIGQVDLTK